MKVKFAIILFLLLLVAGLYWVSDLVKINQIEISGNVHNTEDEILEIVGFKRGLSVLDTIKHRPKYLENRGYIARVDIHYPSITSLKIEVIEKERMGYVRYMSSYLCIDSNAYVIDSVSQPDADVPRIEGVHLNSFALDQALEIDEDSKLALLNIYKLLKSYQISADSIHLNFKKTENISLQIGKIKVQLGDGSRLEEKMGLLKDILPSLKGDKEGILYLENPDKKIVFKNKMENEGSQKEGQNSAQNAQVEEEKNQ